MESPTAKTLTHHLLLINRHVSLRFGLCTQSNTHTIPTYNPPQSPSNLFLFSQHHTQMGDATTSGSVVDLYPLSCYSFGSKEHKPQKDEFLVDRIERMKSNYARDGLRKCVEGILLVELFQQPHLLLLQLRNSFFKLPGGRLRPGETDIDGLKRKLSSKLAANNANASDTNWEIGECIGMWWRPNFETLMLPYCPPHIKKPKECTKLFLVKLQGGQQFQAPKNMKILAVPLSELHDNEKTYGPVISGIPQLLSRFSFNFVRP